MAGGRAARNSPPSPESAGPRRSGSCAGNDGEARVFVPLTALTGVTSPGSDTGQTPDNDTGLPSVMTGDALAALQDVVAALRERAEAADAALDAVRDAHAGET